MIFLHIRSGSGKFPGYIKYISFFFGGGLRFWWQPHKRRANRGQTKNSDIRNHESQNQVIPIITSHKYLAFLQLFSRDLRTFWHLCSLERLWWNLSKGSQPRLTMFDFLLPWHTVNQLLHGDSEQEADRSLKTENTGKSRSFWSCLNIFESKKKCKKDSKTNGFSRCVFFAWAFSGFLHIDFGGVSCAEITMLNENGSCKVSFLE